VQVAALSNPERARTLAGSLGGRVQDGGALHKVQLGPFATMAAAQQAKAGAAQKGYADARIVTP
jgi:rare lipoprotein A